MDEKRIAELRGLCERATAGPWALTGSRSQLIESRPMAEMANPRDMRTIICDVWSRIKENSKFIIAARTALPELLDDNDRLTAENATLAQQLADTKRKTKAAIKNGGMTADEKVALRVAKRQSDETIQGAACIVLSDAVERLLVERAEMSSQLAEQTRRADAAESAIKETCQFCGFENCRNERENADCAIYKWRYPQEGAGKDA
jgi:regulator of replication initiation timing